VRVSFSRHPVYSIPLLRRKYDGGLRLIRFINPGFVIAREDEELWETRRR
jgi:hypothetical protein